MRIIDKVLRKLGTIESNKYAEVFEKLLNKVLYKKLGDICTVKVGSKPKYIFTDKNEYEYINAGTSNSGYTDNYNCEGDTVTTPSRGQGGIGFVGYQSKSFRLGPLCYQIKSKDSKLLNNKYLFYYLQCNNKEILSCKREGGTPAVNGYDLKEINITIPRMDIQEKIVKILDNFEKIVNDISEGIPAEIELRKKQYEYYRDKLLTFK